MRSVLKLNSAIFLATGVAAAYLVAGSLDLRLEWIYALYGVSVGTCIWMALKILTDPWSTEKTFDDYFYQDRPDIRRVGEK